MRRIVFTGPESTGKTTLATAISKLLDLPLAPEFARAFLRQSPQYTYADLATIAKGQLELEAMAFSKNDTIICDTDLVTIAIWSDFKFQKCENWILEKSLPQAHDIFFLCGIDVPWEADPLRENPSDRKELYDLHKKMLEKNNCTVVELIGDEAQRIDLVAKTLSLQGIAIKQY